MHHVTPMKIALRTIFAFGVAFSAGCGGLEERAPSIAGEAQARQSGKQTNQDFSLGLLAQEVERVLPELVSTHPDSGLKAVKYGNLIKVVIIIEYVEQGFFGHICCWPYRKVSRCVDSFSFVLA